MNQTKKPGVPRFIFVLVPAILVLMYYYAAFVDMPQSAKAASNFYTAYFAKDYDTVVDNLSVFWVAGNLPQYESMPPAELLANRDKIMKETAAFFAKAEKMNPAPKNVKIDILKDYTKEGKNCAIVAYQFTENGKKTSMEAAILLKENGKFRMFNMTPIDASTLGQLEKVDINILDERFAPILETSKTAKE